MYIFKGFELKNSSIDKWLSQQNVVLICSNIFICIIDERKLSEFIKFLGATSITL